MRRKLWPKASTKEGALGQMTKNFEVYFMHINFLRNQTKKITREPTMQCYYTCFLILYCVLAQKKWKLKSGPRLPIFPYSLTCFVQNFLTTIY